MKNLVYISILVPSLNTEKYIYQCLNSLKNQTLSNIEIICIDAGSTDGTLKIIENFIKNDGRFKLIKSPTKSYGFQLNLGLEAAQGEYIGIVEPDDFIDSNAFDFLYNIASKNKAHVVKSQWYNYFNNFQYKMNIVPKFIYGRSLNILDDITHPLLKGYLFDMPPSIWSGIYNTSFLRHYNIIFNTTSGASFQDTSFIFKVFSCSKSTIFIEECFLHYRNDNVSSSIHSSNKDFCICDEINHLHDYVNKNYSTNDELNKILARIIYTKYSWNLLRISPDNKQKFLDIFRDELMLLNTNKYLEKKYFSKNEWNNVKAILYNKNVKNTFKLVNLLKSFIWSVKYGGIKYSLWKLDKKVKKY